MGEDELVPSPRWTAKRLEDYRRLPPTQSGQFLEQLHILGQEIAHNLAEFPAILMRDAFQTLLQLAVKVNRQTQACSLAENLPGSALEKS